MSDKDTLFEVNELVNHMLMTGYVGKGTPAEDKLEKIAQLTARKPSAQERFDALPDHWVLVDVEACVRDSLVGKIAHANHPETVLNPAERFEITEVKIETDEDLPFGRIFVRGEETCWFGQLSFKIDVCGF